MAESKDENIFPNFKDINEFTQKASQAIVQAIRCSHRLPTAGDDFDYYSSFDSFRRLMDMESTRILDLIQQIMRYHGIKGNLSSSAHTLALEDKFDVLVDANDQLLERAGSFLDEASGIKKDTPLVIASIIPRKIQKTTASWNKMPVQSKSTMSSEKGSSFRLLAAKNIQRPQLMFKEKIDNSNKPFIPKIKEKPNALKSLQDSLVIPAVDELEDIENFSSPHPYKYELEHFTPLPNQLEKVTTQMPKPTGDTRLWFIDTESDLVKLSKALKEETEIAVDLEHHSYRSFQGFTCLIQISTRTQDYIIDTLQLREELHVLNDVFTDPKIVKILHGASSDIIWLQRDFGLYIVNMFDTGQASRVLGISRFSLAYLLQHYCNVEANKQFQLADWRIRPLPDELIQYAKEDTHYLLYIYDMMKNELLDKGNQHKNLLLSVIQRSHHICSKVYEKPIFTDEFHMTLYKNSKKAFNEQQMAALKGFCEWRDRIARTEDESTGYVLPNHMLLQIAELLPREPQGILACCNPIPPLVRQNLNELHSIIKNAREQHVATKVIKKMPKIMPTVSQHPKYYIDSLLHCPHDTTHLGKDRTEFRHSHIEAGLKAKSSSLFKENSEKSPIVVKESPVISFFAFKATKKFLTSIQEKAAKIKASFKSPFEKFLPLGKDEAVPMDVQDNKTEINKWILLPNTVVETPEETKSSQKDAALVDTTVNIGKGDSVKFTEEEEEDVQPVRYQLPKKRASQPGDDPYPLPSWDKRAKKLNTHTTVKESKPSVDQLKEQGFKPHDYGSTNYNKLFEESKTSKNKGKGKHNRKHKREKDFDPDAEHLEETHKDVKKPRFSSDSSKKSMTYSKTSSHMPKIQWPKR